MIPHTSRSSSRMKRSVRFNLDLNITCKYQASPPGACWYSNEQVRSFFISTVRTASAHRQLVAALRSMQRRDNQHTFLTEVLRLHGQQDILHIHGIEHLVASDSMRMYIVSAPIRLRTQLTVWPSSDRIYLLILLESYEAGINASSKRSTSPARMA